MRVIRGAIALVLALTGCGDDATAPAPNAGTVPLTVERMVATACVRGSCQASLVVRYWKDEWDTHAIRRTVRFVEVSPTEHTIEVTDEAGAPATLELESGRPVTLTVVNPGDGRSSGGHYFTAPVLYRSVAWRKAETGDAEYKAPHFDAFRVLRRDGTDNEVELYFVPMSAGTFSVYCEDGVTNGGAYAGIVSGASTPDLATGHAGLGMQATVRVTGDLGAWTDGGLAPRLEPEIYPDRLAALDADPRRSESDPVWADGTRDETYRTPPIEAVEVSDTELAFVPANLNLTLGRGYVLAVQAAAANMRGHYYTAPDFFVRTVLRKAADSHADIHASYLTAVEVAIGRSTELYLVPVEVGRFEPYCQIGVRTHTDGWPVLTTGHAGLGMVGSITVRPPP